MLYGFKVYAILGKTVYRSSVYLPTVDSSLPVRHTQTGLQAGRISRSRKSYIALEFFARDILYTIYDIRI